MSETTAAFSALQNTLRETLNGYADGSYLRKRARWGYPMLWQISGYAVNAALARTARTVLPWQHCPDIEPLLSFLEGALGEPARDPEVTLSELLSRGYQTLERLAARCAGVRERRLFPGTAFSRQFYEQADRSYYQPAIGLAEYVVSELKQYLGGAWIHGSVGDLRVAKGYSDLDVLISVNRQTLGDPRAIRSLARRAYRAFPYLYRFDPLQHHGLQVMTDIDWLAYPESWLPLRAFEEARTVLVGPHSVMVRESAADARAGALRVLEGLVLRSRAGWQPADAFDLKFFLSIVMLLPTLYQQAEGVMCTKREAFLLDHPVADAEWAAIDRASELRLQWPLVRIARPLGFVSPAVQRRVLAQRYATVLTECPSELAGDAARLAVGLYAALGDRHKAAAGRIAVRAHIYDEPIACVAEDYDAARKRYAELIQRESAVRGLYEYGSISVPGISDLDFVVVVEDSPDGICPDALSIESLPFRDRTLIMHQPIVVPEYLTSFLTEWLPHTRFAMLWGRGCLHEAGAQAPGSFPVAACLIERISRHRQWYEKLRGSGSLSARWTLAILRSMDYTLRGASALMVLPRSERSLRFVDALANLRATWFGLSDSFYRHEQLRHLFEEGEQVLEELMAQVDEWLCDEGWLSGKPGSGQGAGCVARLESIYSRVPVLRLTLKAPPGEAPRTAFEQYLLERAEGLGLHASFLRKHHLPFESVLG